MRTFELGALRETREDAVATSTREVVNEVKSGFWRESGHRFSTLTQSFGEVASAADALERTYFDLVNLGSFADGPRRDLDDAFRAIAGELEAVRGELEDTLAEVRDDDAAAEAEAAALEAAREAHYAGPDGVGWKD